MDRSLRLNGKWSTSDGYSFRPHSIFKNGWVQPDNMHSEVNLLKLHGSTNWLTGYRVFSQEENKEISIMGAPPDEVFVFESTEAPYHCYDGRYMGPYSEFAMGYYPPNLPKSVRGTEIRKDHVLVKVIPRHIGNPKGEAGNDGVLTMPLIIPPIKNKFYHSFGSLFKQLWDKAEEAINVCENLFIIGYSFPKTDIASENLMCNAFAKRGKIPKIIIINPYPDEIINLLKNKLSVPSEKIEVRREYVDSNTKVL